MMNDKRAVKAPSERISSTAIQSWAVNLQASLSALAHHDAEFDPRVHVEMQAVWDTVHAMKRAGRILALSG